MNTKEDIKALRRKAASIIESKQRGRSRKKGNSFKIFMCASDFQPIRRFLLVFRLLFDFLNDACQ